MSTWQVRCHHCFRVFTVSRGDELLPEHRYDSTLREVLRKRRFDPDRCHVAVNLSEILQARQKWEKCPGSLMKGDATTGRHSDG